MANEKVFATQAVNFEVVEIKPADMPMNVLVRVRFNSSNKIYTYVRKIQNGNSTVIDGCRVTFSIWMNSDSEIKYTTTNIERLYDTKGVKKLDATNYKNTSSKIKAEMQEQGVEMPEVVEEPTEDEQWEKVIEETGEVHHEQYENIKACLASNIPVYLAGPAGSGKNHTVEQIAEEMGWEFYFSNSVQQEYKLTGFIDAGGSFHETEFYKACTSENESVFFLDEIDASIPEVLVLLNAAIANGYFEFPNGRVDFCKVHFVAAGNTVGNGADDMYTGRMVIDQATLDRFAIIEFGYSEKIEKHITKKNADLIQFIHQLRKEAESKGIRATFSYRCMIMVTKLENCNMSLDMIIKIAVVKGLDKDTINTLNPIGQTKYHRALEKVKAAA